MTERGTTPQADLHDTYRDLGQQVYQYYAEQALDHIRDSHDEIVDKVRSIPVGALSQIEDEVGASGELEGVNDPSHELREVRDNTLTPEGGVLDFNSGDVTFRYDLHLDVEEHYNWQSDDGGTSMTSKVTYEVPFGLKVIFDRCSHDDVTSELEDDGPAGIENLEVETSEV